MRQATSHVKLIQQRPDEKGKGGSSYMMTNDLCIHIINGKYYP
jgi:hypothetical protein